MQIVARTECQSDFVRGMIVGVNDRQNSEGDSQYGNKRQCIHQREFPNREVELEANPQIPCAHRVVGQENAFE
jgi:hypothetical protein